MGRLFHMVIYYVFEKQPYVKEGNTIIFVKLKTT